MKKSVFVLLASVCMVAQIHLAAAATITVNQFVEHPSLDAVYHGMKDYLQDQKVDVHYIYHTAQANMGTTGQIAKQQIGEKADLIVGIATPSAQACAQAISKAPQELKRPLLFAAITDPVGAGLVKDMAHPEGQITGTSDRLPLDRQVAMIRKIVGNIGSLGIIYNAGEANSKTVVAEMKMLGEKENFKVVEATASKTADVYQAAKSLGGRVDAIFVPTDNTIVSALESLVKVATQTKTPLFSADVDSVKRGAAAALGIDYYKQGRETGRLAQEILNGTPVSQLPVIVQNQLELHLNLTSAKAMGLTLSHDLIDSASKVYGE